VFGFGYYWLMANDIHDVALAGAAPWLRACVLLAGLTLFGFGVTATLESRLGLSPWDVLHQGIARQSGLGFGEANIAVSLVVLVSALLAGARLGLGTAANATIVGTVVQISSTTSAAHALAQLPLAARCLLLVAGIGAMAAGTALYVAVGLGAGPRDSLMLALIRKTGARIALVRGALEIGALALGVALGGQWGFGTVAFMLLIGPAVEASFSLLGRSQRRRLQTGSRLHRPVRVRA
jgi:uncharacterized membrane protein YczE